MCYPICWEFRKWDFYGPKRQVRGEMKEPARAGQRLQEQVKLVAKTVPVVVAPEAAAPEVTEPGVAAVTAGASQPSSHGS